MPSLAVLALASVQAVLPELAAEPAADFPLVSGFVLSGRELFTIYALMIVTGCLVGVIGAGVAVTRFLDV